MLFEITSLVAVLVDPVFPWSGGVPHALPLKPVLARTAALFYLSYLHEIGSGPTGTVVSFSRRLITSACLNVTFSSLLVETGQKIYVGGFLWMYDRLPVRCCLLRLSKCICRLCPLVPEDSLTCRQRINCCRQTFRQATCSASFVCSCFVLPLVPVLRTYACQPSLLKSVGGWLSI